MTFLMRNRCRRAPALMVSIAILAYLPGCGRDARLADHELRDVTAGTFTAYGRTLDQDATPQEVVYVLLQSVLADYDAGGDRKARDAAMVTQFDVCAPDHIIRVVARDVALTPRERQERLYRVVSKWAPVLGYYRDDFRADFETLEKRMLLITDSAGSSEAAVYLNVAHPNPSLRPGGNVVARFLLVKERGYWRIWSVGWDSSTRDWTQRPPRGVSSRRPMTTQPARSAAGNP